MSQKIFNVSYDRGTDNELVEALANAWFQIVILWVLSMGVLSGIAFGIEIWRWPVAVAVPIVAWWFGTLYGRFNAEDDSVNNRSL